MSKACIYMYYKNGGITILKWYILLINIYWSNVITYTVTLAVIHFENGHHGSSGPLLRRTMSPKSKAMSPNFFSGRNIKQAGKCSKGSSFREWINSESDNRQRKLRCFARSKKRGGSHCIPSALTRHFNLADHKLVILVTSLSLREHGSMREKKKRTTKYDDAIELCWRRLHGFRILTPA